MLIVDVKLLLYAFGMPRDAALTLATRAPHWRRELAQGDAMLRPCTAWGAIADFLKNVAITAGPAIAAQTGSSAGSAR